MKRRTPRPKPRSSRMRRGSASRPRPRGKRPVAPVAPVAPPEDRVRAVVTGFSGPLSEWWEHVWPFDKDVNRLAILDDVPMAVVEAFPLEDFRTALSLLESAVREGLAIDKGQYETFERVIGELAECGIPRAELVELTECAMLPVYQWARDRSYEIEDRRPDVTKLQHRLRLARRQLEAASPTFTSAIITKLDSLLLYLSAVPTIGELRAWRRKIGLNRRGDNLWKLHIWTPIATELVRYLREKSKQPVGTFAERKAHALLHARYPHAVDPGWRTLHSRVNRK